MPEMEEEEKGELSKIEQEALSSAIASHTAYPNREGVKNFNSQVQIEYFLRDVRLFLFLWKLDNNKAA